MCAESQYPTALRPTILRIVFGISRSLHIFISLAIAKWQSSASLAGNVSRVHCRCGQCAAYSAMGVSLLSHNPDSVEPVTVLHEMYCCARCGRNYVQFFADELRPTPCTAGLATALSTRRAHSCELCIGVAVHLYIATHSSHSSFRCSDGWFRRSAVV